MKKRILIVLSAIVVVVASAWIYVSPAYAATGIRVSNGVLVEANGTPLKLRGINHAHTWFPSQTSAFANIKATGANAIRVVLSGGRWQPANTAADVTNVINLCKQNRLICVLEDHDTTGFGQQSGSVSLDAAVNYWISVQSALAGQENYVILNIGNEPFGNNAVTPNWTQATISAVQRLRNAGFQHTIMVDAPNWGQDWQFTMRDSAPQVLAADTTGNLIFSIHMYGVFDTAAEVNDYVDSFRSRNLALCICEFGNQHSDGNPDEDTIMAKAQSASIGMMGWSWSGNSGGVEYLDMVTNFDPTQRTSWGTRFITGANGLSTTSTQATIYSSTSTSPSVSVSPSRSASPSPSPSPSVSPPPAQGCTATFTNTNQWPGGFQGQVTVTNTGSSTTTGWTVRLTFPNGQQITQLWGGNVSGTGPYTVTNMSWNGSLAPNASTYFGFLANWSGTNSAPSVTCTRIP